MSEIKINIDDLNVINKLEKEMHQNATLLAELEIKADDAKKMYVDSRNTLNIFLRELKTKYKLPTDKFEVDLDNGLLKTL